MREYKWMAGEMSQCLGASIVLEDERCWRCLRMARDETCRGAQCGGAERAEESRCCRCRHDRSGVVNSGKW
jgi:hypothetical protein